MDAGGWGRPGYRFSRPPINYRGNVPHNRSNRGSRLMSLLHSRPPFHFGQFADNTEMHSESFAIGLEPFDPKQVRWNKKKYKTKIISYPQKQAKQEVKGAAMNLKPQTSGGAVKNPQQEKINSSQPKPSEDAAKKSVQKKKKALRQRAKKLKRAAKKRQKRQAQASLAKDPPRPNPPGIDKPTNKDDQQQNKQTAAQNGGDTEETGDADVPTQPHKKLKIEETILPSDVPSWRGDTSTMFSCYLCQYHTPDEREMQVHFYSSQHKEVLKHLYIFYPKQRVDFLHNYLLFKKRKMSIEQKKNNLQPIITDKFKGIGQEHFLHRIQAAQCQACNVLIPDVPELLTNHIKSDDHIQNCKVTLKNKKVNSMAAAKELLLDKDILEMLKIYCSGRNPFRDTAVGSSQLSSTPEVLVAEEDDDEDKVVVEEEEDDDDDHSVDTNDQDTNSNIKVGQEVPVNKYSGPTMAVNTDEMDEEEEEAAEAP